MTSNRKTVLHRYNQSPLGEDCRWRYHQTPKGQEAMHRANNSPLGAERFFQYRQTEKRRAVVRRFNNSEKRKAYNRKWKRETRLARLEKAYRENPTAENWKRLQNLIARRIRDGQ